MKEQRIIRRLSDRIVAAQKPIRILDAIKWDEKVKKQFFRHRFQRLPEIHQETYRPLRFHAEDTLIEFQSIIKKITQTLDRRSAVSVLMLRICEEYCAVIRMLMMRGTPGFSRLAQELYGKPSDRVYPEGPRISELSEALGRLFETLVAETESEADIKRYSASQAVQLLQERLSHYFKADAGVTVRLSDRIISDASAGAACIKLNPRVQFSDRDLRYLEVHEGWVHVGTTCNGLAQSICTFLSKGSPSSSVTQEGLAVLTEMVTFSSYPKRMLTITNRVKALEAIQHGANFIDVFRFFQSQGLNNEDSYFYSVRLFRGSTPDGGAFTKDLSYTKGLVLVYNYMRLAIKNNKLEYIPLFFVGKTAIENMQTLYVMQEQGLITPPLYVPPQMKDMGAWSAWMACSLFLNQFDLEAFAAAQYSFQDRAT